MKKLLVTASIMAAFSAPAFAAPTLSITCQSDSVTFSMGGLTDGQAFTIDVSQNGSSNWISLGGADASGTSMTIPANVTGSEELDTLTNTQTATYRVSTGGSSATATCS